MYAETLVDGVFKKRRPVHRLGNAVSSKKRRRTTRSQDNSEEQAGNTHETEMENALQSIGKPIEAVLDESGTVVTLIPCLEEEKSGGGCILRSMPHHVMHETPPSSAESYPTAIDVSRSFYQMGEKEVEDDKQVDESFISFPHLDSLVNAVFSCLSSNSYLLSSLCVSLSFLKWEYIKLE